MAFSTWLVPTDQKDHFKWFAGVALRDTSVAGGRGIFTFAGMWKGDCIRKIKPNVVTTRCRADDFIPADPRSDFRMDTTAESAELRVRHKGRTHFVRWTAPSTPTPYGFQESCDDGEGLGAGLYRHTDARGRLFGRRLRANDELRFADLSSGLMASQCSGRDFTFDRTTGEASLSFTTPR